MKTFRYEKGHEAGKTMTVSELSELLSKYPGDMPVFAEWEGVHAFIDPKSFTVESVSMGHEEDRCQSLVVDVNGY